VLANGGYTPPRTPSQVTRDYLVTVVFPDPRFPAHALTVFGQRTVTLFTTLPKYVVASEVQLIPAGVGLLALAVLGAGTLWRAGRGLAALYLLAPLVYACGFAYALHFEERYVVYGYAGLPVLWAAGTYGLARLIITTRNAAHSCSDRVGCGV
jgi:hypothetical protein